LLAQDNEEFIAGEKERRIEQCWREGLPDLVHGPVDHQTGHGAAFDALLKRCIDSVLSPKEPKTK
jgi:hypothetical protein